MNRPEQNMTVAQLREAIKDFPDDAVMVVTGNEIWFLRAGHRECLAGETAKQDMGD